MEDLPVEFRRHLDNVVISVQDEAEDDPDLLGIYIGQPLTERSLDQLVILPDQIILYQRPLEAACESEEELVEEIRITVVHEVGHFFGLSEEEIVDILGP